MGIIRREKTTDVQSIEAVTRYAFMNAAHSDGTEHFIVEALRKAGALTVSLVAEQAGNVIGHVAISPVSISDGSENWFGLGPVSVLPEFQGQGVGSELIREGLDILKALSANGCVVLGEPGYYARFGFKSDTRLALDGVPAEYFTVLAFSHSLAVGKVTYHEAFTVKS
ncbi:putative acetyltransferase [Pseudoalteromonas citrea]|uniref:Acetyltransferase n=2 Tax=Pseudoalteromonas citrea TaxID=43655 RepID=A0AAD4AF73_9GAMM|nr:N-acetyltransferase [Pseudoalteromonas citrea]KAF7764831.1 putative acetyltransferase [Pseudoalteromonas citrea]